MEGEGLWGGQQSGSGGAWRTGDGNGKLSSMLHDDDALVSPDLQIVKCCAVYYVRVSEPVVACSTRNT